MVTGTARQKSATKISLSNDFALADQIGGILRNEQRHQMDQAAALAKDLTDVRIFL